MKNKIMIGIIGVCGTAYATEGFVVLIDKNTNDYENNKTSTSEWITTNTNCSVDTTDSDVYYGVPFTKTESCSEVQERTITKTITDVDGNKSVEVSTETQTITLTPLITSETGTHLESNCEDILSNGYSNTDGYYKLDRGSKQPDVFCDMSEGGYTFYLIPLNSKNDWHNINWDLGWTPSPSFGITNSSDIENECQNEVGLPTFADYKSNSNHYWHVAREFLDNETNYFNEHPSSNPGDGGGIALGLKYVSGKWVTFQNTSTALIPSDTSDAGDHCSGNLTACGFWDARDNHSSYGYGAGPEDWGWSETEAILCGGKFN